GDLHLAEDLVLVGLLQHFGEGRTTALEPFLELGTSAAGGGGLLQRRSTLFLGELGKCHVFLRCYSKILGGCGDRTHPRPGLSMRGGADRRHRRPRPTT